MAERINLAQFDIDTRLVEDKIASNMQKINALKTTIGETKATIKEYQSQTTESSKKIADNTKQQEDAAHAYNEGFLSQEAYNAVIAQTSEEIRKEEQNISRLVQEERQQLTVLNGLQNEVSQYNAENRELNRALRSGITELSDMNQELHQVDEAVEDVSHAVNEASDNIEQVTQETEASRTAFERLKDELSDTRKRANDLAAEMLELEEAGDITSDTYQELRQTWERASQEALALHQQIEQINRSTRRAQDNERSPYQQLREQLAAAREETINLGAQLALLAQEGREDSDEYRTLNRTWEESSERARNLYTELTRIENAARRPQNTRSPYELLKDQLAEAREEAFNLGAQLVTMAQNGQRNTPEYRALNRTWEESSQRARELHDELLRIERATGDNRRNVGNYTESIKEAFAGIGTGFAQIVSGNVLQGFDTLKTSFGEIRTAAKELWIELMANPFLALAAAIVAIGAGLYQGAKAVFEYNAEIGKLNKEIEGLTNLTGTVVDRLREYSTALETVFGKEFKESAMEMNSLMKDFGLTSAEAFGIYTEGMAKGGSLNSEFGDSIREYGVLFAQNGYSAQEFLNLLNAGIDLDVYSDKLPDAIKEAGLSLNEQTKATRDALINAFGQTFSDDLLKRIRSGQTTIKQAVDEISAQAQKVGLNTQQIAQLNADVFKGAGEDAGGLLKIMEAVNLANSKDAQTLTKSQEATIKLAEANVDLEKAKTKALKSDDVQAFSKNLEVATTQIEIGFYKVIEKLKDGVIWFDNLTGATEVISEVWSSGTEYLKQMWNALEEVTSVFGDLASALGMNNSGSESFLKTVLKTLNPLSLLKGLYQGLTLGLKGFVSLLEASRVNITTFAITAKNLFSQLVDVTSAMSRLDFKSALDKLKNFSINAELKKARQEAEKIVALNKAAKAAGEKDNEQAPVKDNTIKNNDKDTGASADAAAKAAKERQKLLEKQQKEADAARKKAEKDLEAAAKQDLTNAKERANVAIQATQAELAEYIAMNAEKLKSDKRLTQARVDELKNYFDKVKEETLKSNEQEREQKLQSLDDQIQAIKGASQQEIDQKKNLEAQKQVIRKEYDTKEIQIINDSYEKQKDLDKNFLEQKREMRNLATALEYQKRISDLETQGYTEFEMQKVQLDQETEQRLESFLSENERKRELDQENYDINAEIEAQRREIENQIALTQDEIKKQNLQNLLTQLNIMQQDYANKEKRIAEEKEYAKLSAFANVAGAMAGILGKQTVLAKTAAIAEAAINTYVGASKALAQGGGIWGIIQGAAVIAAGLANVASIVGIDTGSVSSGFSSIASAAGTMASKKGKAAQGILIGPSHDNGGIDINTPEGTIEAEGGEIIINKKSSAMYRDLLSEINQMGGGVKFAGGGIVGGISSLPTIQNNIKQNTTVTLDQAAVVEIAMAVYEGSQSGIIGLSENREIQRGANF